MPSDDLSCLGIKLAARQVEYYCRHISRHQHDSNNTLDSHMHSEILGPMLVEIRNSCPITLPARVAHSIRS